MAMCTLFHILLLPTPTQISYPPLILKRREYNPVLDPVGDGCTPPVAGTGKRLGSNASYQLVLFTSSWRGSEK